MHRLVDPATPVGRSLIDEGTDDRAALISAALYKPASGQRQRVGASWPGRPALQSQETDVDPEHGDAADSERGL